MPQEAMFPPYLNMTTSANQGHSNSESPASASSPSGPTPQSPNTQLTMSLLNNLLQMQGLENSIVSQQLSASTQAQNQASSSSAQPQSPAANASSPNSFPPHLMLEQQFKLSQLQQLQQLQNQIFQQQIALISGQSPSMLPSTPLFDVFRQPGVGGGATPGEQQMYTGLPTPGPSGEIRPQQPVEFVSPSALSNYMEPLPQSLVPPPGNQSSRNSQQPSPNPNMSTGRHHPSHQRQGSAASLRNQDLQRQLMALSQNGNTHQHGSFHPHPPSPSTFQQQHQPTSPMHPPASPMDHRMSPNTFGVNMHQHQHPPPQGFAARGAHGLHGSGLNPNLAHSAPEHIAFNIYNGPEGNMPTTNIPGLTLGPAGTPIGAAAPHQRRLSLSESPRYGQHQMHAMSILDQDISPLTSPWLGAHPTTSAAPSGSAARHRSSTSVSGNKRMASSSGDEGGSARKKQSPAIRPTLGMSVARLVGRENGSTSPLGSGEKGSDHHTKGHTPPLLVSTGGKPMVNDRNEPLSASSRSGSGSASPDPNRHAASSSSHKNSLSGTSTPLTGLAAVDGSGRGGSTSRKPYRGSKSTNSTPLLRSTPTSAMAMGRTRSKSRVNAYTSPMLEDGSAQGGEAMHDTPSPVDLNVDGDSVDRSMPPPPLPASVTSANASNSNSNLNNNLNSNDNPNRNQDDGGGGGGGGGTQMDVDMGMGMGNIMNMSGMGSMGGMGPLGGMNFSEMGMAGMNNMNGMNGMNSMSGMNAEMDSIMSMGGMSMDMGMGMNGMGMDMSSFGGGMVGMMDMTGMDFGAQQPAQQQQHQDRPPQQQQQLQQNQQGMSSVPSSNSSGQRQTPQQQQQQPILPVTPASIMNLGRLGNARLASTTAASASSTSNAAASGSTTSTIASTTAAASTRKGRKSDAAAKGPPPGANVVATRNLRASARKAANVVSPSLKPLLPAGGMTPNMDPTLPSPSILSSTPNTPHTLPSMAGGSSTPGQPIHVRKTSHKAAEQKRRDSLKTTFDDLRKLLPPIALPNDADVDPNMITSPLFHPTAPLLPGALPPRGPPKAGGEGPNKGVSKLQLLICGNEYIRLLKGRVERRDDEITKLRKELSRLRVVMEEKGGDSWEGEDGEREVLDLERDLDAVEKGALHSRSMDREVGGKENGGTATADDGMDEGDDEGDE